MNLRKINPAKPTNLVKCIDCGRMTSTDEAYADLDGPAFRAFYCTPCAARLGEDAKAKADATPPHE